MTTRPAELLRTLTWDRGKELSAHAQFKIDTGIAVDFADPHSLFYSSRRRHTRSVSAFLLNRSSDLLRIKKSLLKCNWTIRKRLPRCKMRLKKRLLAFSRRLHARIRKTRYMHKMRCLLINRRSLLLALRLLWKTPIFPSNSRFPRL